VTRVERLLAAVAERELDLLLVTQLVNVRWLTGFTGSNALAVLGRGTRSFLTDFRYLSQAAEQVDEGWQREIATDLLARAAENLPGDRAR
jgi:Xaa-Pro aminopeptidase